LLNAQIGWKDSAEKYEIDLYGSNLTNKEYLSDYSDSGGLTLSRVDGRPREYGIKVMVNFGQK
jgi:outer membrane receptor protein involved in Fe transport